MQNNYPILPHLRPTSHLKKKCAPDLKTNYIQETRRPSCPHDSAVTTADTSDLLSSVDKVKPATHWANIYADRGDFDRQRKSQASFVAVLYGHTGWFFWRLPCYIRVPGFLYVRNVPSDIKSRILICLVELFDDSSRRAYKIAETGTLGEWLRILSPDLPDIGDFIIRRRGWSAKAAFAVPGTPGDFPQSSRSAYKIVRCVAIFARPHNTVFLSVRGLFHPPLVEKIKTNFSRFPAKDIAKERGLFDWPVRTLKSE